MPERDVLRLIAPALAAMILLAGCAGVRPERGASAWDDARQLILVIAPDWNASVATLRTYERANEGWRETASAQPVAIGRAGAAWGIGLHAPQPGPQKREGDGRSPAGAFAIGTAFGYAPTLATALPYAALTVDDWCVDVNGSPLYNRIVDARRVGAQAVAGSSEPMRRDLHENGDMAYAAGFVIEHNADGTPNAGSCIFAHIWNAEHGGTAGCTAMPEDAIRRLLRWLRRDAHPLFVLLPQSEYERLQAAWNLPRIAPP